MARINKQIPLYPLLLINFIGTLGFSIVLPFLVFLVIDFGGNAIIYGILAAMYPAFQLLGAPILGRWSDIYGRKKVLLISHGGTLLGWIFFLFALFLPVENLFNISSPFFGTFVITWFYCWTCISRYLRCNYLSRIITCPGSTCSLFYYLDCYMVRVKRI